METILIWLGSGFAFSVGVIVGARLFRPKVSPYEKLALDELRHRNQIGERQYEAMGRIADRLTKENHG